MSVSVAGGEAPRSGPMMAAARGIASEATVEISQEALDALRAQIYSPDGPANDPLEELARRVRPRAHGSVDALQVAALLEADGLNDRSARVEYGFADVFDLAEEVYRRMGGPVHRLRVMRGPAPDRRQSLRDVSHGALYLLPSALFPAVLAVVEPSVLVVALVLAGGLGWVWSGGASWLAFQLLGMGDQRGTGRLLVWSSAAGVAVAAVIGVVVAIATGGGVTAAILVPGVMAYQMASTILVFYHHELWLAALMGPAAAAGVLYVLIGEALLGWALGAVTVCVAVALGTALSRAHIAGKERPESTVVDFPTLLRGRVTKLLLVLGYAALSAVFLLHAQAPYLLTNLDVVLAGCPLIVAMGVVEWRARRFTEQARVALEKVRYPRQFVTRVWLLLAANVVACWLAVALGAVAVLGGLRWVGWLSSAGVVMAVAQMALAGSYFVAFVLAGHDRYVWLCAALAISIVAHLGTAQLIMAIAQAPRLSPFADITLFLGSAVLLQVLLIVALAPVVGQVRRYR